MHRQLPNKQTPQVPQPTFNTKPAASEVIPIEHMQLEQAVFQMNMQEGTTLHEVADYLLKGIERLYPGAICSIVTLKDNQFWHFSAPHLPQGYVEVIDGVVAGPQTGSCGTAVSMDQTVIVSDIEHDPLWKDYQEKALKFGLKACWSVPIHYSSGEVKGTFAIYYHHIMRPSAEMLLYIERWANLVGILMENEQLSREKEERHKQVMKATIAMEEKARKEIGYELHDNVNQLLGAAKLYLESKPLSDAEREEFRQEGIQLVKLAIEEIRSLSKSLVPPRLADVGLIGSVKDLILNIEKIKPIEVTFDHHIAEDELTEEMKLTVYRIIQEQTNNILKYAEASRVKIEIIQGSSSINFCVSDNGIGFNPSEKREGIGFRNMMNRVNTYNGHIRIHTSPGNGCCITIHLPL